MLLENQLFFNEEMSLAEDSIFNLYAFYYANRVSSEMMIYISIEKILIV